jgi:hypothetical protein
MQKAKKWRTEGEDEKESHLEEHLLNLSWIQSASFAKASWLG